MRLDGERREEGFFECVFRKTGMDDVERAREAVRQEKGLLVLVRDLGFRNNLIAGTLVCYASNPYVYALELMSGGTENFQFCNLSEMYA